MPWHLADHHNRKQDGRNDDITTTTTITNMAGEDGEPDQPKIQDTKGSSGSGGEASAPTEGIEDDGASSGGGGGGGCGCGGAESASSAPTPTAPRHGVRVDATDGSGAGSVVYQRYCHVYAEGELEGLVERVDGLRLVESYYDRSNWCAVAEREG